MAETQKPKIRKKKQEMALRQGLFLAADLGYLQDLLSPADRARLEHTLKMDPPKSNKQSS